MQDRLSLPCEENPSSSSRPKKVNNQRSQATRSSSQPTQTQPRTTIILASKKGRVDFQNPPPSLP